MIGGDCPDCGGTLEFVEIAGTINSPTGSIFNCEDCGQEVTIRG